MEFNTKKTFSVGFYNVENLFDTKDNPKTNDDQFTNNGSRRWSKKRYLKKIKKLSHVISQLGKESTNDVPVFVGLVEIENSKVLKDLVHHKNLKKYDYKFAHYDSKDERGIDVALIYRKDFFEYISSKTYTPSFIEEDGYVDYTRDILVVKGKINNEEIHVIINHWPSRSEGEKETRPKRIEAAKKVQEAIKDIKNDNKDPKIIIMGDFNDDPISESIKEHLVTEDFYNPMESLFSKGLGSLTYKGKWNLFDQIIISKNFFNTNSQHSFIKAAIFNKKWLQTYKGKYKGSPYRTYVGPWYKGGYSDHFPVYACFERDE